MISNGKNIISGGVFANKRIVGLDLLRVSLALLIYAFHSNMHFDCHYGIFNDFISVGAIAMTGFFLLSGYSLRLVYGQKDLLDKKEIKCFYLKRILGVLPLYYTLAILYIIFLGKESWTENLYLLPIEMFGLQSTFTSLFGYTHNGGTWFISCLLLGYIIYPFLQTIVRQLSTKQKVILLLVLVFVDLWAAVICRKFHTSWIYDNPFYRIIEFFMGLLVADINITENGIVMKNLHSWYVLMISVVILLLGVPIARYVVGGDYMLLNWIALPCFIIMLFPLGGMQMPKLEKIRVLDYASKISYAFFLAQFFVWPCSKWLVETIGYNHNWVRIFISFGLCILISVIMYEVVQKRLVGLVRKRYNL